MIRWEEGDGRWGVEWVVDWVWFVMCVVYKQ